ncbi:MAG: extracellular solute-binding protein [Armatimonadetes bacterium]|nr:extracellular solute-binding protein [Armatimonadota bacterium]
MRHVPNNGGRYPAAPFCVLLLATLVLAEPAQAQTALRFAAWHDTGGHSLRGITDLLDGFHDRNPDVRANYNAEDWSQARVRLKYWFGSHSQYAPDVTILPDIWLAAYADQLMPLDGVLKAKDTSGLVPAVLDRCRVNGRLVGIPWIVRSRALYCRTDLLEAAKLKPPKTLEELQAAATALAKPPDVYGLGLPGRPGGGGLEAFLDLLAAHGGQPLDKDGKLQLQSKEAEAALAFWQTLHRERVLEPEVLSWSELDLQEAFARGQLAMLIAGPELHQRLRKVAPTLKFGVTALPTGGDPSLAIAVEVLVALRNTQQPEATTRFLRFMASDEAQRAMTLMGGLPVAEAYYQRVRGDVDVAPFVTGLERARGLPMAQAEPAARIVERALWLCLSGRATPAEALKIASDEEDRRIF